MRIFFVLLVISVQYFNTFGQDRGVLAVIDTTVCSGKDVKFGSGSTTQDSYQWQGNYGSGFFDLSENQYFHNVTSDTITITPNINVDGVIIRCSSLLGTDTTYSDTIHIHVTTNSYFEHNSICSGDSLYFDGRWIKNSGFYTATYTGQDGCDSVINLHVSVIQPVDSTIRREICEGDSVYFDGNYIKEEGEYTATYTSVVTGCDSIVTLKLTIIEIPEFTITATPQAILVGDSSQLYVNYDGNIVWNEDSTLSCLDCNNPIAKPIQTTTYTVTIKKLYCSVSDSITVSIIIPEIKLEIPDGFSPNQDGVNDKFVISGLEMYPDNEIKIFNRWGTQVFQAKPYYNNWTGLNFAGASMGDELPEGTYYYVLELNDKDKQVIKGYIYLKR